MSKVPDQQKAESDLNEGTARVCVSERFDGSERPLPETAKILFRPGKNDEIECSLCGDVIRVSHRRDVLIIEPIATNVVMIRGRRIE
jgi:hypothetical protein